MGWYSWTRLTDEKPKVTWNLMKRVIGYAKPYRLKLVGMLLLLLVTTGLGLLTPLIFRNMIDKTIPSAAIAQLLTQAAILLLIPILVSISNIMQRRLNASVGEGVTFDLRVALYSHLQRMSLHFFTNTKVGELIQPVEQ